MNETPDHYKQGKMETIKLIRYLLDSEEYRGFCIGNIVKYLARYKHKDGLADLAKARDYMEYLISDVRLCREEGEDE